MTGNKIATIKIGISGWRYKPWRGVFYPEDLRQDDELHFASRQLPTIEINGTFYNLQKPAYFERWAAVTPEDFIFAVKGPRYITHILRLKDVAAPLGTFYSSGVLKLRQKLGPFLWQFPPSFQFKPDLMEEFCAMLPHDARSAAAFAREHSDRPISKPIVRTSENRPLRHCIEIRHESFRTPEFVELLRKYDIGLVCADTIDWPRLMDLTSDFMYCRLHGDEELYASGYKDNVLDQWAARVVAWARGEDAPTGDFAASKPGPKLPKRDVYVYFDNDIKVKAPADAKTLIAKVERLLAAKARSGRLQAA
jgi:uncharacterized protein YecE (DUF72 family)